MAMMWVVLGHTFSFVIGGAMNIMSIEQFSLLKPFYLLIEAGLFSVDVFFFVGGLLVAYVVLRDSSKSHLKYLVAILQRVLRFWPSYIFAIMFYYAIYLHLGSGPNWGSDEEEVRFCESIWKPLLFVDNIVDNGESECMGWGWYLQNDMQLFGLSMGLLFMYSFKPLASKICIVVITLGSLIFTYSYTFRNGTYVLSHLSDFGRWGTYMVDVYLKPWARCPPYIVGLYFGMIYHEYLEEVKLIERKNITKDNER